MEKRLDSLSPHARRLVLTLTGPKRRTKTLKPSRAVVGILAKNVTEFRNLHYADLPTQTAMNHALARDVQMSCSQVQRVIAGELATGIDAVEAFARVFDVEPYELLIPDFGKGVA